MHAPMYIIDFTGLGWYSYVAQFLQLVEEYNYWGIYDYTLDETSLWQQALYYIIHGDGATYSIEDPATYQKLQLLYEAVFSFSLPA